MLTSLKQALRTQFPIAPHRRFGPLRPFYCPHSLAIRSGLLPNSFVSPPDLDFAGPATQAARYSKAPKKVCVIILLDLWLKTSVERRNRSCDVGHEKGPNAAS